MVSIENIIASLGYNESEFLVYRSQLNVINNGKANPSYQTYRVLKDLNPYAVYFVDSKPFVLFFESYGKNDIKHLYKKIWNSQIPVIIFSFDDHIEIYNGCYLNQENNELGLVENVDEKSINKTSNFSYWNITSNNFWKQYTERFSAPTIDELMLSNIKYVTNVLRETTCKPFAVQIILRLIFIRFLIDRGVDLDYEGFSYDITKSKDYLLEVLKSKIELYKLFNHLQIKFNGNLFDLYGDVNNNTFEIDLMDEKSLNTLYDLMAGKSVLESGQLSLFPLYDFNVIPVELISNIYERFLGDVRQKEDSAFYTPPYLVDYILKQTVKPYLQNHSTCTVLDPACGSGIFLVETLRSLIENNITKEMYVEDNNKLIKLIENNIYGIDKNPEAIDVAIFSLYLTLLDYKDPKTLKNFKLPKLYGSNFFVNDFFVEEIYRFFQSKRLDFIIGNPPWGRVDNSPHIDYCNKNGLPIQNNEIARSFIERTKDFANRNTECCLIVTSKLFYNSQIPAKEFREWFLKKAKVIKYVELAAVRELIFQKARGPAAIVFYKFNNSESQNRQNEICHLTLKPNIFFKLFDIIMIEKNDYKYIKQTLLLEDDWAWKTIVFGNAQDYYNIKKIKNKYKTISTIIKENNLHYGTGIQTSDGTDDATHLYGKKLIDSVNGISAFKVNLSYSTIFDKKKIHRTRDRKLFTPPYVLMKKGFSTKTYKLKAAYSEDEFIYRDAITGIVGTIEQKDILLSLTGLINSSFYAYLNLMLGTSAGIEREQGFLTDIFKFPAVIDKNISKIVEDIQKESTVNDSIMPLQNQEMLLKKIDEYILEYFNLDIDVFVDYVLNVQIPLLTGDDKVYTSVTMQELNDYANIFIEYWDPLLKDNNQFIHVNVYPSIMDKFTAMEFVICDQKSSVTIEIIKDSENTCLNLYSKFMINKFNDLFYQIKDIIDFEDKTFYILKTNESKNWHRAVAKLDLAEVIGSILHKKEDE